MEQFWVFWPSSTVRTFKKKIRLCHFSYLMTMQSNVVLCSSISEKTNKPFMRSNVTNGRSDEHSQICKTLSLKLSNNYNYTMVIQWLTELFLVRIFLHSDWIRRDTSYLFSESFLTHLRSMFPFYIPWKRQGAFQGFQTFSGVIEREHQPEILAFRTFWKF